MENYDHFSMDHDYLTSFITDSVIIKYKNPWKGKWINGSDCNAHIEFQKSSIFLSYTQNPNDSINSFESFGSFRVIEFFCSNLFLSSLLDFIKEVLKSRLWLFSHNTVYFFSIFKVDNCRSRLNSIHMTLVFKF